jgi:hypothetical protein
MNQVNWFLWAFLIWMIPDILADVAEAHDFALCHEWWRANYRAVAACVKIVLLAWAWWLTMNLV